MLPQPPVFRVKREDTETQRAFDRVAATLKGLVYFLTPYDGATWQPLAVPTGWSVGAVKPQFKLHGDGSIELRGEYSYQSGSLYPLLPFKLTQPFVHVPIACLTGAIFVTHLSVDGATGAMVPLSGVAAGYRFFLDGVRFSVN